MVNTSSVKSAPIHLSFLSFSLSHCSDSGWFVTKIYSAHMPAQAHSTLCTPRLVWKPYYRVPTICRTRGWAVDIDSLGCLPFSCSSFKSISSQDPDLNECFLLCSSFSGLQICCTAGPSRVCAHCIQNCVHDSFPAAESIRSHSMGL